MDVTDKCSLIDAARVPAVMQEARADFLYRLRAWSGGQYTLDRLTADKWWPRKEAV